MPRVSLAKSFVNVVGKAVKARQAQQAAIAKLRAKVDAIDAMFRSAGLDVSPMAGAARAGVRRGRKAARGPSGRKRGHFAQTAEQFILGLVAGQPQSTAQINKAWTKTGRAGVANVVLFHLTKKKKVKRTKIEGGKGNMYSVA